MRFAKIMILGSLLLCACSVGKAAPEALTLSGKLVLMGNEPFVYPVVQLPNGQSWELGGISRQRAEPLQNHQITVKGSLARPLGEDPRGPKINVETLTPLD